MGTGADSGKVSGDRWAEIEVVFQVLQLLVVL